MKVNTFDPLHLSFGTYFVDPILLSCIDSFHLLFMLCLHFQIFYTLLSSSKEPAQSKST